MISLKKIHYLIMQLVSIIILLLQDIKMSFEIMPYLALNGEKYYFHLIKKYWKKIYNSLSFKRTNFNARH